MPLTGRLREVIALAEQQNKAKQVITKHIKAQSIHARRVEKPKCSKGTKN